MQLSDREIQNAIDLLKKKQLEGESERVSFSAEEIESIHELIAKLEMTPGVRKDRVDKVRQALESSSYTITGDDVAKKMIGRIVSDKLR